MSTSEFDETGKVCTIWTKCDCVYFFDIEALFWYNGAASLVVGAWSKTHNKIQQKYINYHILFICYKLCLFHQILKCSSCSQEDLTSIYWWEVKIRHKQYFFAITILGTSLVNIKTWHGTKSHRIFVSFFHFTRRSSATNTMVYVLNLILSSVSYKKRTQFSFVSLLL